MDFGCLVIRATVPVGRGGPGKSDMNQTELDGCDRRVLRCVSRYVCVCLRTSPDSDVCKGWPDVSSDDA